MLLAILHIAGSVVRATVTPIKGSNIRMFQKVEVGKEVKGGGKEMVGEGKQRLVS